MSKLFIDEVQTANILQQMWLQRETDQFYDVILVAGAEEIPAHRNILSTATGYFKEIFSSLLESGGWEIKINEVDGNVLKSLIQFIYTGCVEIRVDNVEKLLEAADMLLLNNVATACANFLAEQLDPGNCLGFTLLAERFHCEALYACAKEFSEEHFMEVYKTQEFLKLNIEQLGRLLESDNLSVTSEEHVFHSSMLWLEHDGCEREKYIYNLLKLVRMPLLDPKFLKVHVKPICMSTECRQLYSEVMEWHSLQGGSALSSGISIKPRRSCQYLMGIARYGKNNMSIHYYCPQRFKWMRLMYGLQFRVHFGFTIMGHNAYIVGGEDAMRNILNTVICINMKTMTLCPMWPMRKCRTGCCAAVMNGFLYVLGGYNGSNYYENSIERWDPRTNAWSSIALMSVGRCDFGIAELNKKLYAVGGNSSGKIGSTEFYDPDQNVWTSIASMSGSRHRHGIAVAKGLLYAIGGKNINSVERYDPVTNQWNKISSLRETLPEYTNRCTTFHNTVVVCYKDRIVEYDDTANEWKTSESLKGLTKLLCIFSYSNELPITKFAEN